jgi:hypothetical protein|mmetsp:Transcript_106036/g.167450  ORF Transcript_106036/g.167450 Transcript_106036/m.167450 type:complete len:219 (-) Transcript_106036:302-958(-)
MFGNNAFRRNGEAIKIGSRSGASDKHTDSNVAEESTEQARDDGTEVSADASDRASKSFFSKCLLRKDEPDCLGGEQDGDTIVLYSTVAFSTSFRAMASLWLCSKSEQFGLQSEVQLKSSLVPPTLIPNRRAAARLSDRSSLACRSPALQARSICSIRCWNTKLDRASGNLVKSAFKDLAPMLRQSQNSVATTVAVLLLLNPKHASSPIIDPAPSDAIC